MYVKKTTMTIVGAERNQYHTDDHFQEGTKFYLGIDFGTSGARYTLIDNQGLIHSERKRSYSQPIVGW